MKTKKKEIFNDLLTTLGPHLSSVVPVGQKTPKGLLKTIRHLADQLLRARMKQEKQAAKAARLAPKEAKQTLTDGLTATLDAHFAEDMLAEKESPLLTETADELAGKLTKLRNKQVQITKRATQAKAEPA